MNSQKGFTLIELIIVIVVLGILAVTAAPQLISFSGDAREGKAQQLRASITAASQLVYGKAAIDGIEAQGIQAGPDGTAGNVDDNYLTTSDGLYEVQFGYPAPTAAGIVAALGIDSGEWDIFYSKDYVATPASAVPALADNVVFALSGVNIDDETAATAAAPDVVGVDYGDIVNCYITYTPAASAGARPTVTFTAGTGGC